MTPIFSHFLAIFLEKCTASSEREMGDLTLGVRVAALKRCRTRLPMSRRIPGPSALHEGRAIRPRCLPS